MKGNWPYSCCLVGCCFQGLTAREHAVFLCSSRLAFSLSISLVSMWCIHTIILIQLQLGKKKFCFILSNRLDFYMINNQSITFHAFTKRMLTPLSVDEMLMRCDTMSWIYAHTCIHTCVCAPIHVCVCVYIYIYTPTHMCVHTHTHTHTYVYEKRWVRFGLCIKFQMLGKPVNKIKEI